MPFCSCTSGLKTTQSPTTGYSAWASILLGAGPEQHGVTSNAWTLKTHSVEPTAHDSEGYFPSIFQLVREQTPASVSCAFFDWDGIGILFNKRVVDTAVYVSGFRNVTSAAVQYITRKKPTLSFVYYGHPDEVGHEHGHGSPEYYESIEAVDAEIGELITALKTAGMEQETVVLVVSDHGGVGKGHGGESMMEIEVPWIISGPGIGKGRLLTQRVNSLDTSPTIAAMLGLTPHTAWTGRPVLEALKLSPDSTTQRYVPKPRSSLASGIYLDPQSVSLTATIPDAEIRYTVDGSEPGLTSTLWKGPLQLDSTVLLKAVTVRGRSWSRPAVVVFTRVHGIRALSLLNPPSSKYPARGPLSLVDGELAGDDVEDSRWMGFEGADVVVSVDFGRARTVHEVAVRALQNTGAWIFLPDSVIYQISDDSTHFRDIGRLSTQPSLKAAGNGAVLLRTELGGAHCRWLRVRVKNVGLCPPGHPGAGQKAWLFVDEILLK